jgi:DNA polymerase-3 subunit delta
LGSWFAWSLAVPEKPVHRLYVLHGHDDYLRRQCKQDIIRQVIGESQSELVLAEFDESAELSAVLDELRTAPFLAPRRLVVVHPADGFVSRFRAQLEAYLEKPSATGSLLLVIDRWQPNAKIAKLAAKVGEVIACTAPAGRQLEEWLAKAAGARGKKLARDAAVALALFVGQDLARLDSEIEKLCLYVADRKEITEQDVLTTSIASAGPADFALANAVEAGRTGEALAAMRGMITRRGQEFRALGMLNWAIRRRLSGKGGFGGWSRSTVARPVPARAPAPPRPAAASPPRGPKSLRPVSPRQAMRLLLEADLALKSGAEPFATLEVLITRLCAQKSS